MISQLESVVNAVQQEDQTTAKILEGALTEEVTRIRDETEAIILPTVEKVMSTHSMPHPKWMSDQVCLPHWTSCAALTHSLVCRDHVETTV